MINDSKVKIDRRQKNCIFKNLNPRDHSIVYSIEVYSTYVVQVQ